LTCGPLGLSNEVFWHGPGSTRLNRRLGIHHNTPQDQQWAELLAELIPNLINDSFLPSLTERLENLDRAGFDAGSLVQSAAARGPLPDDHPAAALWWRILDELPQPLPNHSNQTTPAGRTPERYET
jgi:hypothetical protein